jgi:hypothetical protein
MALSQWVLAVGMGFAVLVGLIVLVVWLVAMLTGETF